MDNCTIILPRDDVTAVLKRVEYTTDETGRLRKVMESLMDPEGRFVHQVQEIVIASREHTTYKYDSQPDEDGLVDILGYELDTDILAEILGNAKQLDTFTWCVNMPIPQSILDQLQQAKPNIQIRHLKIQKTDAADFIPKLDFYAYNMFPQRQYFDRNDFGCMVYTSSQVERSLRLHLLVPYYPVHEGERELEWLRRKDRVATAALEAIEGLTSVFATDHQGELARLVPSLLRHGPTLRSLGFHTQPAFALDRPKGPSCLSADDILLLAQHMHSLTHFEVDIKPFISSEGVAQMVMPFAAAHPSVSAIAAFKSLRTLRLWVEVPMEASVFQDSSEDMGSPPLKEDQLVQAVANIYALLKIANTALKLDWLEVAFTRVDSWDRQDQYPRFLPVRLMPDCQVGGDREDSSEIGGFGVNLKEWQDDYSDNDVYGFIDYVVGHIY